MKETLFTSVGHKSRVDDVLLESLFIYFFFWNSRQPLNERWLPVWANSLCKVHIEERSLAPVWIHRWDNKKVFFWGVIRHLMEIDEFLKWRGERREIQFQSGSLLAFEKIINKRGLYIGDRRCWRPSNCFFFVFLTSGPGVHYTHPRGKIISRPFCRRRRRRNEIEFRASPASLYLRHCVSSKNCLGDVWRARRRKSVKLNRVPRQHTPAHIQQQQQQQHRLVALHPGNERHRYIERGWEEEGLS